MSLPLTTDKSLPIAVTPDKQEVTSNGNASPASKGAVPVLKSGYIPTLDGWRAIAVLMVIISHTTVYGEDERWYQFGMGVNIFFGLSGLLVCSRLLGEQESTKHISLRGFYARRIFRILPAAWLYLTVIGTMGYFGLVSATWGEIRACLLLYRNYIPFESVEDGWYTRHFWSLVIEEHFYLTLPLLLILIGPKRALWVFPLMAMGVAVWRSLDARRHLFESLFGIPHTFYRTDQRFDALMWGCWVAILIWRFRDRIKPWFIRTVGLLSLVIMIDETVGQKKLHNYVFAISGLFIPLILAATALCPKDPLSVVLEWAPLRWIGRLSYSLYLWQELFFVKWPNNKSTTLLPLQSLPWNWVALFFCASLSYYLIERPLTRYGHRIARPTTVGRPTDNA